jgi:hypothetical protein
MVSILLLSVKVIKRKICGGQVTPLVLESATARPELAESNSLSSKAGREFSKADSVFSEAGNGLRQNLQN